MTIVDPKEFWLATFESAIRFFGLAPNFPLSNILEKRVLMQEKIHKISPLFIV